MNSEPNTEALNARQAQFLAALLSEPSVEKAARKANVSARTGFVYLKDETFGRAYQVAKREAVAHATARLQAAAGEAVDTLREVMCDGEAMPSARVAAAKAILETAYKATELETVTGRLDELEAALAELRPDGEKARRTP